MTDIAAIPAAPRELKAEWLKAMAGKLASDESRARYKLRRQTVEPVFGIVKAVPGFTGFSPRGLDKFTGEWDKGGRIALTLPSPDGRGFVGSTVTIDTRVEL